MHGGTGYLTLQYTDGASKTFYHGFHKNETGRLHCYYMTNKGYGSEFLDTPKTLGIAIYCPLSMDNEVGEYAWNSVMQGGYFCRIMADHISTVTIRLRPSHFSVPLDYAQYLMPDTGELVAEAVTEPAAARHLKVSDYFTPEDAAAGGTAAVYRPHAVCTVQTFRNAQTGPMLYLFVSYYHRMGWRVIVYDRFGFHREFIEDLLPLPGFDYYNYTIFQLVNPTKYSPEYAKNQGFGYKIYYSMEKNWGYAAQTNGTMADVADQDADKARTYDHSRVEYAHLDTMMYIDSDELLFCPQAGAGIKAQRRFQQRLFNGYAAQGIEEMRLSRLPYSGLAPAGFDSQNRSQVENNDFTSRTAGCMQSAYSNRSVVGMLGCWSQASSYDDFPKSADMGGVCPFHYNHWSCDGMRGGGRDGPRSPRCRCKVGLELNNFYAYRPMPDTCHLAHFNNNKYRFQFRRIEAERERARNKEVRKGRPPPPAGVQMHHGDASKASHLYHMFAHGLSSSSSPSLPSLPS